MRIQRSTPILWMFFLGFFVFLWHDNALSANEPFIIIANRDVPAETLSRNDLKDIFLGVEIVWKNSQEIRLCTLKESDIHTKFTRQIANKTTQQFKAWWKKRLFLGQGSVPPEFDGENELIDYVANTKGAIGYVSAAPQNDNVKTITISE